MADTITCPNCEQCTPPGGRCVICRSFLPGNAVARKHGLYGAYEHHPPEVIKAAAALKAGLTSDLGGAQALSTLEASYVEKLADCDVMIRLITRDIARNGLLTPGGRVRDVYDKLLAGLAAFDRYAQRVGLERRQRAVSITEIIAEHDEDEEEQP